MESYRRMSDNELTELLIESDHAAYTEIFNRYWAIMYRHARKMLFSDEEARDIVQEVFTTLWVKADKLNISSSIAAYLYVALRNRVIDHINKSRIRSKYLESLSQFIDTGEFVTDNELRFREFAAIIEAEIATLPPRMREVFNLSRKQNLTHKQIAEQLSISDKTVKKQVNNAINILKEKLGPLVIFL